MARVDGEIIPFYFYPETLEALRARNEVETCQMTELINRVIMIGLKNYPIKTDGTSENK